jgi:ribonuclease D
VNKAHQRADWAMRPLPPDMLQYAAMDTHYLIDLYAKIRAELEAVARWPWAEEEFVRLTAIRFRESEEEEPFRRLKGIGSFDRRSLAIVRDLYGWRDELARKADRPPFKIIGNDVLLEIAKEKQPDLKQVKAISRYHVDRYGRDIARIVRAALELPEDALPERGETKPFFRDRALEVRVERLKKVRDRIARDLKLDPSLVAPRHVLTAIATIEPRELTQLDGIPAMRNWQKAVVGPALIEVTRQEKVVSEKLF